MNFLSNLPLIANGTINPSVFVMIDSTRNKAVLQAVGSPKLIGVSQVGPKQPPGLLAALGSTAPTTQPAAVAGDEIQIFAAGDVCGLTVGCTAVTSGDLLTNDGNGCGITATTGKFVGAIALESGNPGEVIDVLLLGASSKA